MRRAMIVFLASIGVAAAAACSSSSDNGGSDGGGSDGGGGSGTSSGSTGGSGSGAGGGSRSGSGVFDAGMAMQIGTVPTLIDGGVYCPTGGGGLMGGGMPTACASPQVCCWGDQTQLPAPLAGCTSASMCTGSVIACSNTGQCGAGQVCCFAYGDAGMAGPWAAQCAAQCPTGDMVHYRLCASDSECASGETCTMMAPYSPYCMAPFMMGDGGPRDGGPRDGAGDSGQPAVDAADAGAE
jgi:hypothetical protein